ncbi:putative RNA-directed DNA polymerase from transposon BS, partial [Stegodyphus mimosarum]
MMKTYNQENWQNFISNISHTDHSVWKIAKAIKHNNNNIGPIKNNNEILTTPKDIANLFADNYQEQFSNNSYPCANDSNVSEHVKNFLQVNSNIKNHPTSPQELKIIIKDLNIRKSTGYDGISNAAVKNLPIKAIVLIVNIMNACL